MAWLLRACSGDHRRAIKHFEADVVRFFKCTLAMIPFTASECRKRLWHPSDDLILIADDSRGLFFHLTKALQPGQFCKHFGSAVRHLLGLFKADRAAAYLSWSRVMWKNRDVNTRSAEEDSAKW
mmetsp:Transcript_13758/g.55158  ORF Transcript_13758/g.55158 Transcript_13758/m.55158 type:complete len:124 (-) Transcript_13758:5367-5738(-)